MREIYVADDGKTFVNKEQCESYEYCELKFPLLNNIKFIDENNNILSFKEKRVDEEAFYIEVEKIIINNKEELNQLHNYAEECGFVSWQNIDAIGAWEWNEEKCDFVPCVAKCIYATKFDDEVYYIGYNNEVRCFDIKGSTGKIGKQSLREAGNCFKEKKDAEAHKKMYMAIANNEVPSKGEWLEKTNPYPTPYYHELTNNCFACDEAKRRREKAEVELRYARNDSGILIYHSPESICKYCPLLGKDDEFGRCLNGLYNDFCCAKGFDKFKLAYEIANLEWR